MFRCEHCGRVTKPGESMVRAVVETRDKVYRDSKDQIIGHGFETVRELRCCTDCGTEVGQ